MKKKSRRKLQRALSLLYEKASRYAVQKLRLSLTNALMEYPPYMVPKDNLKRGLRGKTCAAVNVLRITILGNFEEKEKDYSCKDIEVLICRCNKYVAINGDYMEKQYVLFSLVESCQNGLL